MRIANYRKTKQFRDQCFEKYIQWEDEIYAPLTQDSTGEDILWQPNKHNEDNQRCWKALKYKNTGTLAILWVVIKPAPF